MPNLESLVKNIAEIINGKQEGEVWFTSKDMVRINSTVPRNSEALKFSVQRRRNDRHLRIQNRLLWPYNNTT